MRLINGVHTQLLLCPSQLTCWHIVALAHHYMLLLHVEDQPPSVLQKELRRRAHRSSGITWYEGEKEMKIH